MAADRKADYEVFYAVDDSTGSVAEFFGELSDRAGENMRFFTFPYWVQIAVAKVLDAILRPFIDASEFTGWVRLMSFNHDFSNDRLKN
ncbi:hypothetical protein ACFL4G_04815, partial [Thermodesulfobacteriota bacterium]